MNVSKDFVAHGTDLNTNVVVFDQLGQVRVHAQVKSVANTFGAKQYCVVQFRVLSLVTLARMQIQLKLVTEGQFNSHDLVKEVVNGRIVVFFVDHVEARNQVGLRIGLDNGIKLRLNVTSTKEFEAAYDETHLKEREHAFDNLLNVVENGQFLFKRDEIAVVVENTAENVSKFDHSHHFFDKVFANAVENLFEERSIVDQLESELEFELEAVPDSVIFPLLLGWFQSHLVFQHLVEVPRIFPILSQGVHFNETFFRAPLGRDVEFVYSLRIVDAVLVGEAEKEVKTGTGSEMTVVNDRFGHHF